MRHMGEEELRMVSVTITVVINVPGNLRPGRAPFKTTIHKFAQERIALGDASDVSAWAEVVS